MSSEGQTITREELRKKNLVVVIALASAIALPWFHFAFLARFLPQWLNALIIGGILWVCFAEVIPAFTVGLFRSPKIRAQEVPDEKAKEDSSDESRKA